MKSTFRMKWPLAIRVVVCLCFVIAGVIHVKAQGSAGSSSTGSVHGTVLEQSGHVVKGANVALISESRDVRHFLSGSDGKFDITGVPAGSYTVEISAPGFATIQRQICHRRGRRSDSSRYAVDRFGF